MILLVVQHPDGPVAPLSAYLFVALLVIGPSSLRRWSFRQTRRGSLVDNEGFAVDASLIREAVSRQRAVDHSEQLPDEAISHAVGEYFAVLEDAAFGDATPVAPEQLAVADCAARWTAATRKWAFFAYSTNYLIDVDNTVTVDVEATTSVGQAEVTTQRRMIERTGDRFGLGPEARRRSDIRVSPLAADTDLRPAPTGIGRTNQ